MTMLASEEITSLSPRLGATQVLQHRLEARLAEILSASRGDDTVILGAMRYVVLAGGKRIRPLALLLLADALGSPAERILDIACGVEFIHAASLVLDDLPCMDDAQLRRSQPAVHVEFGEDVAVLVAIALLGKAWELVAASTHLGASRQVELVSILSRAVGAQGLVQGQYRDIRDGTARRSLAEVEGANDQKTGALFSAVFEMAACACGASPAQRELLLAASRDFARAFQVQDDLHDFESCSSQTGKDSAKDVGKSTAVALLGPASARALVHDHLLQAERALREALPGHNQLIQLFRSWIQPMGFS